MPGDRHFRPVIAEYLEHYHRERNHQGLDNELIAGAAAMRTTSPVRRRARLVGLEGFASVKLAFGLHSTLFDSEDP